MSSPALDEALRVLGEARQQSDSILVSFSGGKDSLVCLDLAVRMFKRVECFFMYLVPGLECQEAELRKAEVRFGIPPVRQYPHWVLRKILQNGTYTWEPDEVTDVPNWTLKDVYTLAAADAGIKTILMGGKLSDSLWRRRQMGTVHYDGVVAPIKTWNKLHVVSYLKMRGIALPPSSGKSATGIDLSTPSLLWLHDTFPADFAKLCKAFPFAEAVVHRRRIYGCT